MTWFKVDDSFYDHPKVEQLSLAARGLWVTAGSYAARHLTDGYVPLNVISRSGRGSANVAKQLVSVGLWVQVEGGFRFHNWDQFQPSKETVEHERSRTKERQQAWRERKRNAVTNGSRNGVTNSARGDGAPTRPDPTITPKSPTSPSVTPSRETSSADADTDFNTFWKHYPRKVGQGAARTAWQTATSETTPASILAGLKATLPQLRNSEPQFIPHPATWLRDERWTDTPDQDADPWAHLPHIGPA